MKTIDNSYILAGTGVALLAGGILIGHSWAAGIPSAKPLVYSGLLQNSDGSPLAGTGHTMEIKLWSDASATSAANLLCDTGSQTLATDATGHFSVALGDECTKGVADNKNVYVETLVDGIQLGGKRTRLGAVPYAVEANHALESQHAVEASSATAGGILDQRIAKFEGSGPLNAFGGVDFSSSDGLTGTNANGKTAYASQGAKLTANTLAGHAELDLITPAYDGGLIGFAFLKMTGSSGTYTVDKNAPLMVIQRNGNVGIGTGSPRSLLDVQGTVNAYGGLDFSSIDGLAGTNANGKTAYASAGPKITANTMAGNGELDLNTPAYDGGRIGFAFLKMGGSNGSYTVDKNVPLMVIQRDGKVGIGIDSPGEVLDVKGNIRANNVSTSDASLKKHVRTVDHALADVSRLRGVRFEWKSTGKPSLGVIAQEVEAVYPELVSTGSDHIKSVEYGKLTAVLIEAAKELERENANLRARMSAIEARLQPLSSSRSMVHRRGGRRSSD